LIPPNPDESDSGESLSNIATNANIVVKVLPSQVHPSYPYGNPTSLKHPASKPQPKNDPASRALFEDMGYGGGGINGSIRWRDLALDELLPIDEDKEEAKRAMQARKMASGAANNNPQGQHHQQQVPQMQQGQDDDEDDDDDENDENNEDDEDEDEEDEEESEGEEE